MKKDSTAISPLYWLTSLLLLSIFGLNQNLYAQDTIPPIITLNPGSTQPISLNCNNAPYIDPGVTAIDNVDGDLSNYVITVNPVNTQEAGVYWIKYSVTDFSNNTSTAYRKVSVFPKDLTQFEVMSNYNEYLLRTDYINSTRTDLKWVLDGKPLNNLHQWTQFTIKSTPGVTQRMCMQEKHCKGDSVMEVCQYLDSVARTAKWISLNTYIDVDSNCIKGPNEHNFSHPDVFLIDNNNRTFSEWIYSGEQSIILLDSNTYYKLKYSNNILFGKPSCPYPDTLIWSGGFKDTALTINFAYLCKNEKPDFNTACFKESGLVFPGQTAIFKAWVFQPNYSYCKQKQAGHLEISFQGKASFKTIIGQSTIPDTIGSNRLVYISNDMDSFIKHADLRFSLQTDTSATINDSIQIRVKITNANDLNSSNNVYTETLPISNSYDPNDIEVFPKEVAVGQQPTLTFRVQFQNTGNAPAINVKVRDTLDPLIEYGSLELISSTHPISIVNNGRSFEFQFNNINLSDSSTDEEGSKGSFVYRVKLSRPIKNKEQVNAKVAIYFDFNTPIFTPTAICRAVSDNISSIKLNEVSAVRVYPNPCSDNLTLQLPRSDASYDVKIMSSSGQRLIQKSFVGNEMTVDVSELAPGIYFLNINNQTSQYTVMISINR